MLLVRDKKGEKTVLKKILPVTFISIAIVGGAVLYRGAAAESNIVVLENQKKDIDSELAIKAVNDVKHFEGLYWLNNDEILGVKNQVAIFGNNKSNLVPSLTVYSPKTKSFKELAKGQAGEPMGISYISKDEKYVFYDVLRNGDLSQREYDIYLLDMETLTTKKLVEKMTATSRVYKDKRFIAVGMQIFQWDMKTGNLEELPLPKDMIEKLSDFQNFSFQKYVERYYRGEKLKAETLKLLEANYNSDKENNGIIRIACLGNELYLQSRNASDFIYDITTQKYRPVEEGEHEKFFSYQYQKENNLLLNYPNQGLKRECKEDGTEELWKVDGTGNRVKLIAKGNFITNHIQASPDRSKLAYYFIDSSNPLQERSTYVYDLEKDKQIKIFSEMQGEPIWNKSSKQFFMSFSRVTEDKERYYVTSIVNLND